VAFELLVRGEFRVRSGIMLMALYGAAILAVPLLLNSIFVLSSFTLGLAQYATAEQMLASLYEQALSSYNYVAFALFAGFVLSCFLIGRGFGRNSQILARVVNDSGGNAWAFRRAEGSLLLLVTLLSTLLAFCISLVLVSAALYVFSVLVRVPDVLPSFDLSFALYIALVGGLGYASLVAGAFRKNF
jgi:hypothetical protein